MIRDHDRLESRSAQGADWGYWDTNLSEYPQHVTAADLCLYGMPSAKCGCGFCREMIAREREGGERI